MTGPKSEPRRRRSSGPRIDGGSRDARKVAMLILEVLGGQRTPTDAAKELGVSATRYYGLEAQGLRGLVEACEPRRRGPGRSADKQIEALKKQVTKLERECARRQALIRLSQRALGVSKAPASGRKAKGGKRRRKRPAVRALKAAEQLDSPSSSSDHGQS